MNRFFRTSLKLCQIKAIGKYVYLEALFPHRISTFVLYIVLCRFVLYNVTNLENLRNLTNDNFDGAYMAISSVVDYFNLKNFPNPKILKTKQYIQLMPFCMYFRKHSCLVRPFNEQISLLASSGLIVSWDRTFKTPHYSKNVHMEPNVLSINQITGLITVCTLFIALSIIVFSFEMMSTKHETIRTVFDFLSFNTKQQVKLSVAQQIKHSNLIKPNRR